MRPAGEWGVGEKQLYTLLTKVVMLIQKRCVDKTEARIGLLASVLQPHHCYLTSSYSHFPCRDWYSYKSGRWSLFCLLRHWVHHQVTGFILYFLLALHARHLPESLLLLMGEAERCQHVHVMLAMRIQTLIYKQFLDHICSMRQHKPGTPRECFSKSLLWLRLHISTSLSEHSKWTQIDQVHSWHKSA